MALIKKLRKKKKEAPANEKPDVVKTHLRNMVIKLQHHDRLPLMLISGHCPRDDWIHCWSLQRQGLHTGNAYACLVGGEHRETFWPKIISNAHWPVELCFMKFFWKLVIAL